MEPTGSLASVVPIRDVQSIIEKHLACDRSEVRKQLGLTFFLNR
jgi:hypothetical protein